MSKQRVKNVSLEEDYIDDYDGDDYDQEGDGDLSVEDKDQLRLGTVQVRAGLGSDSVFTDQEIQEALWHYYYDVGKSVSFLQNKQRPAVSTKAKKTPGPAQSVLWTTYTIHGVLCGSNASMQDFFGDCPWLNVPPHRKADILIEPLYFHSGLLGGSSAKEGKMSKLAALAAKRRLKENERIPPVESKKATSNDEISSSLDKLRISSKRPDTANSRRPSDLPRKPDELPLQASNNASPSRGKACDDSSIPSPLAAKHTVMPVCLPEREQVPKSRKADPSRFAMTLIGRYDDALHSTNTSSIIESNSINNSFTKPFDFTDPSPDDIVTKAQETKGVTRGKAAPKQTNITKAKVDINKGIKNLSVEEPFKIKSKNLDVVAEYAKRKRKNAANFVVIGHVDAGKSTLMGRLLFDLKAVDQRTMDRYKKEAERIGKGSFAFAWVLDQGSEERARGVTIDVATNKFETDKTSFTILDAPGHRDFVPNMIAGASQADFAVLVIDASTGNFEAGLRGQTKEHALLARSMGVQKMIVAVNKMDAVEWSQERFREIELQMSAFLTSAGFQPKNTSFIPCSGLQGDNILRRSEEATSSWYRGPTLVQELDTSEPITYALDKPLRMAIADVFRGGVQNPLSVSGRVEAGNLQIGEQILIMPSGEKAFVKSLEVDEEPSEWAVAGQNVVLNLTDIDPIHLKTGDMLCSPAAPVQNTRKFTAKVLAFDHLTPMNVDVHRGRLHVPGRISQLVAILDKSTGVATDKKKPKIVQPGNVARVVVELESAVPLSEAGRIVLRSNGETVATGLVE